MARATSLANCTVSLVRGPRKMQPDYIGPSLRSSRLTSLMMTAVRTSALLWPGADRGPKFSNLGARSLTRLPMPPPPSPSLRVSIEFSQTLFRVTSTCRRQRARSHSRRWCQRLQRDYPRRLHLVDRDDGDRGALIRITQIFEISPSLPGLVESKIYARESGKIFVFKLDRCQRMRCA